MMRCSLKDLEWAPLTIPGLQRLFPPDDEDDADKKPSLQVEVGQVEHFQQSISANQPSSHHMSTPKATQVKENVKNCCQLWEIHEPPVHYLQQP